MTYEEEQRAAERIDRFLAWMWEYLRQHCLEGFSYPVTTGGSGTSWRPLVEPAAMQALREAWRHFESDHTLADLQRQVREAPRASLIEHGLYGAQLNAKLRMVLVLLSRCDELWADADRNTPVQHLVSGWAAEVSPPIAQTERRPRKRGFGGMIKSLKDLITGMDVFADSVFDAAGIGKALKEIKELFGMSLDDPVE